MSTDRNTDGSNNPFRDYVRSLLKPFTDKGLSVRLVLVESDSRHYVSVAKKIDQLEGLFELKIIPTSERNYRGIERVYTDSVFIPDGNLKFNNRPEIRVNITGKNLTQLTREQADYLYKKGL